MVTEFVVTLLLALHLLCVNAAAGGPLVAAWLDWRAARGDDAAAGAARYLAGLALLGLIAGGLLGGLIGWLNWSAAYRALWTGPLSYKAGVAGIELAFSLVLLAGWWLWLPRRGGGRRWAAALRGLLAVLAATNLLYHFPLLFAVAARLYDQGQTAGPTLGGAGFRELAAEGETPALAVHVALASVAAGGVLLLGLALRWQRQGNSADAHRVAVWGGRWSLVPTLAQLPVGLLALAALRPEAQIKLMGDDLAGILLFVASFCAALWLMRELASVSLGETARPVLIRAMAALLVTVILMTAMQRQTRVPRPASSAAGTGLEQSP